MSNSAKCPGCGRELTGVVDVTTAVRGNYVFIVQRETSDCNWTICMCCRRVVCKRCRRDSPQYCFREGPIIDRERARAGRAHSESRQSTIKQEV